MADPLLGKMVGEYQVTARISPGETGGTYRVRHRFLKIDRSLQLIMPAEGVLAEVVLEEARLLASVRHKNLVRIHDRGHLEDGGVFFLTELLNGESLRRGIQRGGALPVRDALKILRDVAAGLAEAHALGVVHRAIRPESIFLAREGGVSVPKLVEFGLGLPREQEAVSAMVASGGYAGGAQYAAPEQLGELGPGDAVDSRADVYAMGLCLYEALTGSSVFHASEAKAGLEERLTGAPGAASERAPQAGIEPELDQLLNRMLAVERSDRLRDAREIAASLDKFLLGVRRPVRKVLDPPAAEMRYFDTSQPAEVHKPESVRIRGERAATDSTRTPMPPPPSAPEPEIEATKVPPAAREVRRAPPKTVVGRAAVETKKPVPAASTSAKKNKRGAEPTVSMPAAPPADSRRPLAAPAVAPAAPASSPPLGRVARPEDVPRVKREAFDPPLQRAPAAVTDAVEARIGTWAPTATRLPTPSAVVTRRPFFIAVGVGVLVAILAIVFFASLRGPRPVAVAVAGPDLTNLEQALASGERSKLRAWLRDFPESPHRDRAYLGLIDAGMPVADACRHARDNSPKLLAEGGKLAAACSGR